MKGCLGALLLLLALPLAVFGACAGGGIAGFLLTLCATLALGAYLIAATVIEGDSPLRAATEMAGGFSSEASILLDRAAAGDAGAQFDTARMFEQGELGVPADLDRAKTWSERAAKQGHRISIGKLEFLAAQKDSASDSAK